MKMVIFCRLLLKNTFKSTKVCGNVYFGKTFHFTPSLRSPFWILPLVCSLHFTLSMLFALVRSLQSAVRSPQSRVCSPQSSFYTDRLCICCERFVFAVSDLYLMSTICIWCERFVICCGGFVICCEWCLICCEWFEFAVSDLSLMWVIWICCAHFVLMWQLRATACC